MLGPDSWRAKQWVRTKSGNRIYQIDFDSNWVETRSTQAVNCWNLLARLVGLEPGHKGLRCDEGYVPRFDDPDDVVGPGRLRLETTTWWSNFPEYKRELELLRNLRKNSAEYRKQFQKGKITVKRLRAGFTGAKLHWDKARHEWAFRPEEVRYMQREFAKRKRNTKKRKAAARKRRKEEKKKAEEENAAVAVDDDDGAGGGI